jgi:hypothetical protein
MSATAFKNAVRRREHYERHQPAARKHLGLLEKHKDYTQRAKAYHVKEKRIAELRKKASNRNPDEFYFKMLSTATKVRAHNNTWGSRHSRPPFPHPPFPPPSHHLPRRTASTRPRATGSG